MSTEENPTHVDVNLVKEIFVAAASQAIALRQAASVKDQIAAHNVDIKFGEMLEQAKAAAGIYSSLEESVTKEGTDSYFSNTQ
ncbi:MAG: hypothetical protein WBG81_08035 [Rhodanobacter sp.]